MDSNYSKELAMFFDTIRYQRGMTQLDFVEGIISIRQYRRYLSGESKMTQDVINQLSRRLGFKPEHIILDFEASRVNEMKLLIQFYNAIVNYDQEKQKIYAERLEKTELIDPYNKLFLKYAYEMKKYYEKKITEAEFVQSASEIIDYPNILKRDILSANEIVTLATLLTFKSFEGKEVVASRIKILLEKPNLMISGDNSSLIYTCMVRLSTYYGIQEKYQEVIDICLVGAKNALEQNSFYLLDYFYYNLSLAYHYLNQIDIRDEYLYRLFIVLEIALNKAKYKKFKDLVEEDYQINFEDFIHDYMKKHVYIKK